MKKRLKSITFISACFLLSIYCAFFLQIGNIPLYTYILYDSNECMSLEDEISQNLNWDDLEADTPKDEFIKWMSFDVPLEVMNQALKYDVDSHDSEKPLNWIELIAYCTAKNWGTLKDRQKSKDMDELVIKLQNGEKLEDLTKTLKLYPFYLQAYTAVLKEYVGEYEIAQSDPQNPKKIVFVKKYGLKVFSPIAEGYYYNHYDDFGASRTYGYKRPHLGHDMMGSIGTPIIAVEDGYVEALGWNCFGGWRIGIRSADKQRYYYYAHLQKNHPFHSGLEEGDYVHAGDVIGYLGQTGYSSKENVSNIKIPHLHFGVQIIFDESQKDGVNQIWLDCYNIISFLNKNKMPVYRVTDTKDFNRKLMIQSPMMFE